MGVYSTAVDRVNPGAATPAAAGTTVGWVLASVNGRDLARVNHTDVLQVIRGSLHPPPMQAA